MSKAKVFLKEFFRSNRGLSCVNREKVCNCYYSTSSEDLAHVPGVQALQFKSFGFSRQNKKCIVEYLVEVLGANDFSINKELYRHPKKKYIQIATVKDTVEYLINLGFSKSAINESIAVCFYPRVNLEKAMKLISEKEEELNEAGLFKGFSATETNLFSKGTHMKDKRLQLCLYYMELNYCFSGSGIFCWKDKVENSTTLSDINKTINNEH